MKLFSRTTPPAEGPALVGRWQMVESEAGYDTGSGVSMEFAPDGTLTYTIHTPDKEQVILLTWRLDGEYIITDQASSPAQVQTRFSLAGSDRLIVELNGEKSFFVRAGFRIA